MKKRLKIAVFVFAVALVCLALVLCLPRPSADLGEKQAYFLWESLARIFAFAAVAALVYYAGYRPLLRPLAPKRWVPVTVAAGLVAVNNLPILALASGGAAVTGTGTEIALFGVMCLTIGLFEEWLFRGLVLPFLLERFQAKRRGVLYAVLCSSAIFALSHLLNLGEQGVPDTLLQVGYTFLVGCMTAVVYLATGNLLFAVALHAVYDFCGKLLPFLGTGYYGMDAATAVVTAALAAGVAGYFGVVLANLPYENSARILPAVPQDKQGTP